MKLVEVIKDSIYDSLEAIFRELDYPEAKIVFANENGLEPTKTYCIVNILDRQRQGRTSYSTYLSRDAESWDTEFFTLCLRLSFNGKEADSLSWDFDDGLPAIKPFMEEFQKRKLGFLRKSKLRRIPQPRETQWVDAWNLDVDFSFAIQSRHVMDWVEFITINGEVFRIYPEELEERTTDTEDFRTTDDGDIRDVYSI